LATEREQTIRRGTVSWFTHPPAGRGRIEAESSAFHALPVSLPEGDPIPHEATPGELLALTHGVFLASFLSEGLLLAGSPADEIVVDVACIFVGPVPERSLTAIDVHVRGRVSGLGEESFRDAVATARLRALRSAGAREDLPGELLAELAPTAG
jgi:hypothetical protein